MRQVRVNCLKESLKGEEIVDVQSKAGDTSSTDHLLEKKKHADPLKSYSPTTLTEFTQTAELHGSRTQNI
eukprot:scaffold173702_cov19-Prasinocladus_malaysianus.AAC.1